MSDKKPVNIDAWVFVCNTLKNMPYSSHLAIAELIDNSTMAIGKVLEGRNNYNGIIEVVFDDSKRELRITDNGCGFNDTTRKKVTDYGTSRQKYTRNRYNVGMKNAIYWLGNEFKIYSKDINGGPTYEYGVKLDVENITGEVYDWKVSDHNVEGTEIIIYGVRPLANSKKLFEDEIKSKLEEIYTRDLQNSKYSIVVNYLTRDGKEFSYNLKTPEIYFELAENGVHWQYYTEIHDEDTDDKFKVIYKIMNVKTNNRMKKSGFHFYYQDRLIKTFSVPEITSSNTNIYKRSFVEIDIISKETELSFLKNDIALGLDTKSYVFGALKREFDKNVVPFFDYIHERDKRKGPETPPTPPPVPGGEQPSGEPNSEKDEYIFNIDNDTYIIEVEMIYRDTVALRFEEFQGENTMLYLSADLASKDFIERAITLYIYTKYYSEYDITEFLLNGEFN